MLGIEFIRYKYTPNHFSSPVPFTLNWDNKFILLVLLSFSLNVSYFKQCNNNRLEHQSKIKTGPLWTDLSCSSSFSASGLTSNVIFGSISLISMCPLSQENILN